MANKIDLFPADPGMRKGARTRLMLYKAAYECIARDGYHGTTFQTVADHAGVSQPLVVKIFGTRENLFPTVAGALLARASELTEESLTANEAPHIAAKVRVYFEISVAMLKTNPDLAMFYMNIYYLSTYDPKVRQFNTTIRKQAVKRLEGMTGSADLGEALHDLLTGFILNTISLGKRWDMKRLHEGAELLLEGWE